MLTISITITQLPLANAITNISFMSLHIATYITETSEVTLN